MSAVMQPEVADDFDPFAGGLIERVASTTEAQRELWLGDRLSREASLAYNEAIQLRLHGPLDTRALASALDMLVARHESLRSTISPDGTQLLVGEPVPLGLACHDLSALDEAARERRLDDARQAAVLTPFVLEQGPLFRAELFRLSAHDHLLLLAAHHAVCDGWSWSVITRDLAALHGRQTGAGPAPEAPERYSDYADWEAREALGPAMQANVDYWLSRFAGSLPVLELPLDRPRPAVRTFRSHRVDQDLDPALVNALRRLGAQAGTSLTAVLFGGFAGLLHRLTGQEDLVIGIAAAGQLASDMPTLVGHCVNLLPLRIGVEARQPFAELLRLSGSTLLDAFEHQTLTYGALLKKLPIGRDPSRLPLVSVLFNVDPDLSAGAAQFAGLAVEQRSIPRRFENFELFLNIVATQDGGMRMEAQFNADLYDDASVRRWLDMYDTLLRSAVASASSPVGHLALLSPAQARAVRDLQPAPTALDGAPLMHAGFIRQAAARPEQPALRHGAQRWTYRQLDERSNRLAQALRARGIGRGQRVGLCLDREPDMFTALLAVLKSGAAYVPLDPAFPQARLDYYAEDAQLALLLTSSTVAAAPRAWCADAAERVLRLDRDTAWQALPGTPPAPNERLDARGEDAAYVIYTSGSTGRPKGVCVPHRAVANLMQSMQQAPGIGCDDRLAAVTTLSFDMAVPEVMLPLAAGAEIVIVQRDTAMDGNRLAALLQQEDVSILQATPGMWRLLLDAGWTGRPGFRAWIGAESVPADLALELLGRSGELWNLYGPTETTVWSTAWKVERDALVRSGVAIGRPIANTGVWIMDALGQPCPVGVPGEVCIGGLGVTLGYLDRPELTAERFVTLPVDGADTLLYRTGDRGRWRNDGLLEHMGRFDFQVKVRGYRIELGEIEARCNEVPGVARSVVVAREDEPGDVRLVAYLQRSPDAAFDAAALDRHLRERLPQYMLPQHVVALDALPQLPNGKIDRRALPRPEASPRQAGERVPPRNPLEQTVLAAMEEVLRLPGIGIHDDFFALGGHSLLAARLTTQLGRHFDMKLPLATLFQAPTAARLAEAVEQLRAGGQAAAREQIPAQPGRRSAPLTPQQERIRFVETMHPGRSVYNAPSGHRFTGALDLARFEAALREIVRRHDSLRTRIGTDPDTGAPVQEILPGVELPLEVVDLRALPEAEREVRLMALLQAGADAPFDIHQAPLCRFALYRLADDEHAFLFVPHHLVWDGWSFDLFQAELSEIYGALSAGRAAELPALPVSYGDYAAWYVQWLGTPECDRQLAFWKQRFAQAPRPVPLPTDRPRRGAGMSGESGNLWVHVDADLAERLRETARVHDVTLSMLCFSVYVAMMGALSPTGSIVVATPVRGREQPELEPVMGFFNNVLPLSFTLDRSLGFDRFARYVKGELMAVMNHQQVPFERLVAEPEFAERVQGAGLYQALFSFQDARGRPAEVGGLGHRQLHLRQQGATDDMGLWLMDKPSGLEGAVTYNADIYLPETGEALRQRYAELLAAVAARPTATLSDLLDAAASPAAAHLRALAERPAAADRAAPAAGAAPAALLQPEQARLAQIWASALGIDVNEIGPSDTFFDLGGDSLMVMRVTQQAEAATGLRVEPRRYVFETLAQLADPKLAAPVPVPAAATTTPAPRRQGLLSRWLPGRGR